MYIIKLSIKPVKTPGNTVPLPERVRCSRVGVGVQQNLPGGYPCHALKTIYFEKLIKLSLTNKRKILFQTLLVDHFLDVIKVIENIIVPPC